MLTLDYDEELNEEYDDVSCMTRETGIERSVYRHAVDDSKSESNIKRSHAATRHLYNTSPVSSLFFNRINELISSPLLQ